MGSVRLVRLFPVGLNALQAASLLLVVLLISRVTSSVLRGIEHDDVARGYLALVVNSNFERTVAARGVTPASTDTNKPAGLAPYLSYTELARLVGHKLTSSVKRVVRGR